MINRKLLLSVILALGFVGSSVAKADRLEIEVGDRPYYTHGARYADGEYDMMWVPGHWSDYGHHWIHGHYRRLHRHHHHDGDRD
ncbi:MAG: hypothetical protein M3R59_09130 [Verrucomicrobiota bacterium]|nr:hypothetical protein [Verrucomicrobiota bacterium]